MLRMKTINCILVILSFLVFAACEKEDNNGPKTDNDVNQWIEKTMRDNYLWNSELPEKNTLNFDAEPEDFFHSLLSDKDGKDLEGGHHYFSTLEKVVVTKSGTSSIDSYGFEFVRYVIKNGSNTYKAALIIYVLKDSPAEQAGLKRGNWIIGVNGGSGSIQEYEILESGGSVSFQLAEYNGKTFIPTEVVTVDASRLVEDTPFLKDSIYTYGNTRIGYLMYNHFASGPDSYTDTSYDLYLQQLFAKFKSQNVNEFVLDLRYNGGGLTSSARLLTSLLAPEDALGDTFCIFEYNENNKDRNKTESLLKTSEVLAGNLNLKRLFVLTGNTTASASELVINSLKPYLGDVNVCLIGKQTFGKTVGMTIYDESEKYGWILSPVAFRSYNKDHKADYDDGFVPDILIDELDYDLADFGDMHDPLLSLAVSAITGRSDLKSSRTKAMLVPGSVVYSPKTGMKNNMIYIPKDN